MLRPTIKCKVAANTHAAPATKRPEPALHVGELFWRGSEPSIRFPLVGVRENLGGSVKNIGIRLHNSARRNAIVASQRAHLRHYSGLAARDRRPESKSLHYDGMKDGEILNVFGLRNFVDLDWLCTNAVHESWV